MNDHHTASVTKYPKLVWLSRSRFATGESRFYYVLVSNVPLRGCKPRPANTPRPAKSLYRFNVTN